MVKEYIKHARFFFEEMTVPLFVTEWGRRASLGALALFSLLFLISFVSMVVSFHSDISLAALQTVKLQSSDVTNEITQIPTEHLFGNAAMAAQNYVPITSLQLHLVGVVSEANVNLSHAIISEAGAPGKVYAIGDSLPSGIRVYAIHDEDVILENSGHLEKLPLARSRLNFQGLPKSIWSGEDNS